MNERYRTLTRIVGGALLLTLPVALIAACGGGGFEDDTTAAPADVPELGAAQLGAGAGPTPVPVTPTPTPTPSPKQISVYEPVWEGSYTISDVLTKSEVTKAIVVEFLVPKMFGEGNNRRRDEGAMQIEGIDWLAINFTRIDPETGSVSFRVPLNQLQFNGVLEEDKITGTLKEGVLNKGTFELRANRDKTPQRRPEAVAPAGL